VGRGFLAFVGTALAGQLVGFATWLAGARAYGARLPLKLGWLYLVSFHRVGIRLTLTQPFGFGDGSAPAAAGPATYTFHVAMLCGTILSGALLFRAGRIAARRGSNSPWTMAVIALGYAVPILVGSLFVTLRFPDAGVVGIRPVAWESFALPALFAATVAGVGALSLVKMEEATARARAWFRAGARMFAAAILLAFVGFVVLAGVRPDASGAYLRWIGGNGSAGALVATHHVLLLPNQSLWIFAPAMGSCDELAGGSSEPTELCGRSLTIPGGVGEAVSNLFGFPYQAFVLAVPFLLFALVPAVAVIAGAARSSASGSVARRLLDGAASGVVFSLLVWVGALVSRITIDEGGAGALFAAGPEPVRTGLLALAWGIVGGAIGSGLFPNGPQVTVGVSEAAPAPPSPTSV
jgi:hypothetical protein